MATMPLSEREQTDDERGVDHAQRLGATVAIPPIDNGPIVSRTCSTRSATGSAPGGRQSN